MNEPFRRPEQAPANQAGNQASNDVWLHCSACRKDIPFQSIYFACSVSTCNRARTQLVFCSVACWDSHLATLRHREAWAVEERAPTRAEWLAARSDTGTAPTHRSEAPTTPLRATTVAPAPRGAVNVSTSAVASASASASSAATAGAATMSSSAHAASAPPATLSNAFEREILIVVSKMKKYIKERSGMNTSDAVAEALGDHVRAICDQAIHAAAADGRKTVLDRDVPPAPRR